MSQLTNTPPEPQTAVTNSETQTVSLNKSQLASICAAGLLISFFLPLISFLFGKLSGDDLAKLDGFFKLLWAIPIFSAITIFTGVTKNPSQKAIAQLTGSLPFFALGAGLYHEGGDLIKVLEIGSYAGLGLGLILFLVARRLK